MTLTPTQRQQYINEMANAIIEWDSRYGTVAVKVTDVDEDGRAYFEPNALGLVFSAPVSDLRVTGDWLAEAEADAAEWLDEMATRESVRP